MADEPHRMHFAAFTATTCRWTGTNQDELARVFGEGFEEHLIDQPLIVGSTLYRPDGQEAIFIASQRVVDARAGRAMPGEDVWEDARVAFAAVTDDLTPSEDGTRVGAYQQSPAVAQRAIDALGELLDVHAGYGGDGSDV